MTVEEILQKLAQHKPLSVPPGAMHRSAVLLPMRPSGASGGTLELILTRRTDRLLSHSGQVALPGGRIDAADSSPEAAALREAHEEIGLDPGAVELCGRLDQMLTVTGYHITPVVGLVMPSAELAPNPHEVARVFSVPMAVLLRPDAWEERIHTYGHAQFPVWHVIFDGEDIWGATAHILRGFVELLWE